MNIFLFLLQPRKSFFRSSFVVFVSQAISQHLVSSFSHFCLWGTSLGGICQSLNCGVLSALTLALWLWFVMKYGTRYLYQQGVLAVSGGYPNCRPTGMGVLWLYDFKSNKYSQNTHAKVWFSTGWGLRRKTGISEQAVKRSAIAW